MFRPARVLSILSLPIRPYQRCLAVAFLFLASMPGVVHGQPLSDEPAFRGLALQLRTVATSEWTGHESVPLPPEMGTTSASFREEAAYGLGVEASYALAHGVTPFVAADFNLQAIHGQFGGFNDYGTVAVGARARRPLSHQIVPFVQADVTLLRVAAPKYTQPFLGGGMEFFLGRRMALSAALELPVSGSSSLDKRPHRFSLGASWYLGH